MLQDVKRSSPTPPQRASAAQDPPSSTPTATSSQRHTEGRHSQRQEERVPLQHRHHARHNPFIRPSDRPFDQNESLLHGPQGPSSIPVPELELDMRLSVTIRPELSESRSSSEGGGEGSGQSSRSRVATVSSGSWLSSFGSGTVMAGGYTFGQKQDPKPIRTLMGLFVMQTKDTPPAVFEVRIRGSVSGPSDVLDTVLDPGKPKGAIDQRSYSFRSMCMFKTTDRRYVEWLNSGLWVASGVWNEDSLILE